jgi:hypothetical protein
MSGVSAGKAGEGNATGQVESTPVKAVEARGDTTVNTAEITPSSPKNRVDDNAAAPGMMQVPYGAVALLFAAAAALAALGDRSMLILLSVAAAQVFVMRWSR